MGHRTLINHKRLSAEVYTGREGPEYDPYSYTELTVETPGGEALLHEGLGTYLRYNGYEVETNEKQCRAVFAKLTGYTVDQIERMARKLKSRCRKCGGKSFHDESGYPGESFDVCDTCGNIHDSFFNISAIE